MVGPIVKTLTKGILKSLGTPGRKRIAGVKVKKIPKGKRGISKKEMQRAVKEEPIKGKVPPGWYAKRYATKGQRRKMGETDLAGGETITPKSKKEMTGLRGQRKFAEQKKAKELKNFISNASKKLDILENDLDDAQGAKMFKEPTHHNITKLKTQIKKVKKAIREAQHDLKKRPKVNRKGGGKITYKKKGGPIEGKPVNGIKGKKVAQADWMKGLSQKEIDQILGKPLRDASGVKHSQKKKKKKPTKVRKAKVGGKVITYRMTGGQVVDSGYD